MMSNAVSRIFLEVMLVELEICCLIATSFGFRMVFQIEEIKDGIKMIALTANVQNQRASNTVQPAISKNANATGVRLRLRLSNIFQRERAESAFLLKP